MSSLETRVTVSVVGQTTTVTLDYAAGNRILAEETLTSTTLYLHGRDCLGEFRAGDWLYYLPDAEEDALQADALRRAGLSNQRIIPDLWLISAIFACSTAEDKHPPRFSVSIPAPTYLAKAQVRVERTCGSIPGAHLHPQAR